MPWISTIKTFPPRYRLLKGVTGKSDPLVIARRLSFPEDVVNLATSIIEEKKSESEITMEDISRMQADLEGRVKDYDNRLEELEERERRYKQKKRGTKGKAS